jgi:hypothetical protein
MYFERENVFSAIINTYYWFWIYDDFLIVIF